MKTLPALCRELLDQWKNVELYLSTHAPRQEMQAIKNRVRLCSFSSRLIGSFYGSFPFQPDFPFSAWFSFLAVHLLFPVLAPESRVVDIVR